MSTMSPEFHAELERRIRAIPETDWQVEISGTGTYGAYQVAICRFTARGIAIWHSDPYAVDHGETSTHYDAQDHVQLPDGTKINLKSSVFRELEMKLIPNIKVAIDKWLVEKQRKLIEKATADAEKKLNEQQRILSLIPSENGDTHIQKPKITIPALSQVLPYPIAVQLSEESYRKYQEQQKAENLPKTGCMTPTILLPIFIMLLALLLEFLH